MKTLSIILSFFLILSCSNLEKTKPISNQQTASQDVIKPPPPKGWFNLTPNKDNEEVIFDTIPILDNLHFACLEFHDIDDVIISLIRNDKGHFTVLIPKFRKRGGFYDTVLVQDYNFDGVKDIDFVIRPGCRSGANAFHNIYLKKGKQFTKATIPQYSYLSPLFKEKTIYGIYNGTDDFELIKAKWKGDSLFIKELVDIKIIERNAPFYYKTVFYKIKGNKKVKVKEESRKTFPESYMAVLRQNILR